MWQNFWKLWKLIERFSHTHDHKFMLLVFISWCLTDISLFFSLLQGLTNWWWRMESITYIGTRNFKRFQHFLFSNSTQLQYNLHIMWKGRNSKTKMKLCKRMMKKFLSLFFDVKVFFRVIFIRKINSDLSVRNELRMCVIHDFNVNSSTITFHFICSHRVFMGKFSTWLLLHVYVWQTSVKERESIEMKLSRENLIWFPFFLSFYL